MIKITQEKIQRPQTKGEIVAVLGLDDLGSVDYALPQNWVDSIADKVRSIGFAYDDVVSSFVWFYPSQSKCNLFGYPYPLCQAGVEILQFINIE